KDFRTELVEGKGKRAGTELAQEITKKQKVEDDKETTKIKMLMEIILDEEVAIDAIPMVVKSLIIFDFRLELVPLSLLVSEDVILSTVRSSTKHNLVLPSCGFVIL
ncbi:hypothetical protein Tco_1559361, partial [Tanacetum coccineum]